MDRDLHSCPPKRSDCGNGKRRTTTAFPAIKAEVTDALKGDEAKEFAAPAATDDGNCDTRMARKAPQSTPGQGRQPHLIWARRDLYERAVKIEKHGNAAARLDPGGDARPIRDKAWSHVPKPPHRVSTRSGDRKSTRLNSSHLGISYAVF